MRIQMLREVVVGDPALKRVVIDPVMLRDAPEIHVVPGHLLEHRVERLKRPEERVVHEDDLIVGSEGLKAQMKDPVPVAAEVEPDIRPVEDLVRVLLELPARLGLRVPVHDREDRSCVLPKILKHAENVPVRDSVLVEKEENDKPVFCCPVNDHSSSS